MISPLAYVDSSAKIGENVTIHPFAYIDADVEIGDGCVIMPYASIIHGTRMGKNNKVYQGSIVGADPQDFRWKEGKTYCVIGDNNIIREHVIINRSIYPEQSTRIDNDTCIMAEAHIGHDCHIEDKCVIGNNVTIAGDTEVGTCSIMSSGAILHENCKIGKWALIKGGCRIGSNVPPYVIIAHNPASFYGVNAVVLRKGGFTEEQIDDIAKCYRHLYQCSTSVLNALRRIEGDVADTPLRQTILDFIRGNNLRIAAVPEIFY